MVIAALVPMPVVAALPFSLAIVALTVTFQTDTLWPSVEGHVLNVLRPRRVPPLHTKVGKAESP